MRAVRETGTDLDDAHSDGLGSAPRLTGVLLAMILVVALLALAVPASAADTPAADTASQAQSAPPKPAEATPSQTVKHAARKARADAVAGAHAVKKAAKNGAHAVKRGARKVKSAAKKALHKAEAEGDGAQVGMASYYAKHFNKKKTASGEKFSSNLPTAAHKTLPIGTHVKVTNLQNGQSTTVRVNDRGPYKKGRVIDLSKSAAQDIGMTKDGVAPVKIEVVGHDDKQAPPAANNAAVKQEAATQKTAPADQTGTAPAKPASAEMAEANTATQPIAAPSAAAPAKVVTAAPMIQPKYARRW